MHAECFHVFSCPFSKFNVSQGTRILDDWQSSIIQREAWGRHLECPFPNLRPKEQKVLKLQR